MDPISPAARREAMHEQISEAQMILRRAAAAAALKSDPLAEQLQALAVCIGALSDLYQASEATQTGVIADEAIARVHASGMEIVNKLAPQLTNAADRTMRQKITALRIRSIVFLSLALALSILLPSMFSYGVGLNDGRAQAEIASHLIPAAMKAGPAEAIAWGQLMQDNDGAKSLAACRKSLQQNADGRHYCLMPIGTDPVAKAPPSEPAQ